MKKLVHIMISLALCIASLETSAQSLIWEQTAGGDGLFNEGRDVSTDQQGNCYVVGNIEGVVNFSTTTTFNCQLVDIFIAKYNTNGYLQWVKQAGSIKGDNPKAICTDAAGNSFIIGDCDDIAQFGSYSVPAGLFLAKYDPNGNCSWATPINCIFGADDVCLDDNGNIYVLGGGSIAKFAPSGNCVYTFQGGIINYLAMSYKNGYLYTTGVFTSTVNIALTTLTNLGGTDVFVVKYDTSGNAIWARCGGGPFADIPKAIATDALGNCHVLGSFYNNATFGTYSFFKSAVDEPFLVEYDASGSIINGSHGNAGSTILIDASNTSRLFTGSICYDKDYNLLSTGFVNSCKWTSDPLSNCIYVRKKSDATQITTVAKTNDELVLYPNPVSRTLSVKGVRVGATITVTTILGVEVMKVTADKPSITLDLSNLQAGVYVVSSEGVKRKIIKNE